MYLCITDNLLNLGIQSTSYADFGLTNLVLLWFIILFIGWVVVLREFKKESGKSISGNNISGIALFHTTTFLCSIRQGVSK